MSDTETVEAVYVVTIRNEGDERAIARNELEELLTEYAPEAEIIVETT